AQRTVRMNEMASSVPDSEPAATQAGRELALARERCGYSVGDVARQLKLSPAQVEAMEADQYDRLPGARVARGFIRNYARRVKLDPEPLLAHTGSQSPSLPLQQPQQVTASVDIPFPRQAKLAWRRYAVVALIVLAALVTYEFYRDDETQVTVKSRPTP